MDEAQVAGWHGREVFDRDGAKIGKNSIVGAHTLVPEGKVFPDNVMLMGTPAKVMRELTPEQARRGRKTAGNYAMRAQQYKKELILVG